MLLYRTMLCAGDTLADVQSEELEKKIKSGERGKAKETVSLRKHRKVILMEKNALQ